MIESNKKIICFISVKTNWWSELSFDEINHAAQTPQCLETCYMSKHTSFSTHLFIIYMFQNGDWPCLLVNDGVAFFREFRPKTWGPCNKLKFLAWKQTHLTSKCLEMCKIYRSIIPYPSRNIIELRDWLCCADDRDDAACIWTSSKKYEFIRLLLWKNEWNHFKGRVYKHGVCWKNDLHHQSS